MRKKLAPSQLSGLGLARLEIDISGRTYFYWLLLYSASQRHTDTDTVKVILLANQ